MGTPQGSDSIAVEEWKLLQASIRHQQEIRMRLRNWGVTLLVGLAVAGLSAELSVQAFDYLLVSLSIVLLFWGLEATYHQAERRAIDRSDFVEMTLRGEHSYDGPLIGVSMKQSPPGSRQPLLDRIWSLVRGVLQSAVYLRLACVYVGLAALTTAVAVAISY